MTHSCQARAGHSMMEARYFACVKTILGTVDLTYRASSRSSDGEDGYNRRNMKYPAMKHHIDTHRTTVYSVPASKVSTLFDQV